MSETLRAALLSLLEQDEGLHRHLRETGFIPEHDEALLPEHLELARVAQTLVSELEVNWAGVEVVLRMRSELIATRKQVSELVMLLRERHGGPERS